MDKVNLNYIIPVVILLGAVFFLTPSFTGSSIVGGLEESGSNLVSIILVILGVASFVYFKRQSSRKV